MIRHSACLMLFVTLCAVASAQGSKPRLSAMQQQQLFERNRAMIQILVDSSVEITAQSGDYLQRSKSYRKVIKGIEQELNNAAIGNDARRVAELGKHLDTVMRQGLAPSLQQAISQVGPNGTGRKDIEEIRERTVELVEWLQDKARNRWADTPEVREVIDSLEKTKKEFGKSVNP